MKKLVKLFIVLLSFIPVQHSYAQKLGPALIDSLLAELPKQKEDTIKAGILLDLSLTYTRIAPVQGIKCGEQALRMATDLGWKTGTAKANNRIALNYQFMANYPVALEYYFKAQAINEQLGNKKLVAINIQNIGGVYYSEGDYIKALDYFFKALKMDEENGSKTEIFRATTNISNTYSSIKEYDKALEYYDKALTLVGNRASKAQLSPIFDGIATVNHELKKYKTSMAYDFLGLKMSRETGDKALSANILTRIGMDYFDLAIDTSAKRKAITASDETPGRGLAFTNKTGLPEDKALSEIPRSAAGQIRLGIDYIQQGLEIAKQAQTTLQMMYCYEQLRHAYNVTGDFKKAFDASLKYEALKDSIYSKNNNEQVIKLSLKNEYDRQRLADSLKTSEKEKIASIKLSQQRTYTFMGMGSIMLLAISVVVYNRRKKQIAIQLEKAKSAYFSNIAHDFRTPVSLITGPIEQLLHERNDDQLGKKLAIPLRNAHYLARLTNQLLDVARLESGAMKLYPKYADLDAFISDLVNNMQPMAADKKINLTYTSFQKGFTTHFDADSIEKIVQNLVSNAIKFSKEGGNVQLSLSLKPDRKNSILISIKDDGVGISETDQKNIFKRFFRSDETHTTPGIGLGLSLAKELVTLNGGNISLLSGLGKGSEFMVALPVK